MSLRAFYEFVQTLEPRIKRNVLKAKALEITGHDDIRAMYTGMDAEICRGFYLSVHNQSHRFVQQHGCNVIVLPREGLNPCWRRLVYVKEMMHLFDDVDESTKSGEEYGSLLNELQPGFVRASPQYESEVKCLWLALAALCPERYRLEFIKLRDDNLMDDFGIATHLKIPQQFIPALLSDRFKIQIEEILKDAD